MQLHIPTEDKGKDMQLHLNAIFHHGNPYLADVLLSVFLEQP
ncbi:hypothetical protein SAMN04488121_1031063 [Chitinophaga filiformis]|uniref:Uncharacterized protein n=1 Tax=Chitinophaga filiformis TaxID=104663 RepID=A0A1G7SYQ4_CHIFI|nr:hypothetical protein SAMN04488121_1031063 [Chitinophaga filiformis]